MLVSVLLARAVGAHMGRSATPEVITVDLQSVPSAAIAEVGLVDADGVVLGSVTRAVYGRGVLALPERMSATTWIRVDINGSTAAMLPLGRVRGFVVIDVPDPAVLTVRGHHASSYGPCGTTVEVRSVDTPIRSVIGAREFHKSLKLPVGRYRLAFRNRGVTLEERELVLKQGETVIDVPQCDECGPADGGR